MQAMNWVDYTILAIIFFSVLAGFARGFVREMVGLITLFASFIIATMFCHKLALKFTQSPEVQGAVSQASTAIGVNAAQPVSYMATGMSFILIFIGIYIVGSLFGYFFNMIFQYGLLGLGNRMLGGGFGILRGLIFCVIAIFLVQLTPFRDNAAFSQSSMVKMFDPAVAWVRQTAAPSLKDLKEKVTDTVRNVSGKVQDVTSQYQGFGQ